MKPQTDLRRAQRAVLYSAALTLVSLALATASIWFGVTYGWLAPPSRDVGTTNTGVTSAGVAETVGYDAYKYDEDDLDGDGDTDEGIACQAEAMQMNLFDKILLGRNERTPLILRAVLSPSLAQRVEQGGSVNLQVSCASAATSREHYDLDGDGVAEEVDWLSNVVTVRADYIPEIVENVEGGTIPLMPGGDAYKSEADYVYRAAVDHFADSTTATDPVSFVAADGDGFTKRLSVSVDLSHARASNGYYYIYFLVDYEPELVTAYMRDQHIEVQIGAEAGVNYTFRDIFRITVAEQESA